MNGIQGLNSIQKIHGTLVDQRNVHEPSDMVRNVTQRMRRMLGGECNAANVIHGDPIDLNSNLLLRTAR